MQAVLSVEELRALRARCGGETPSTACVDAICLAVKDGTMHNVLRTLALLAAASGDEVPAPHCAAVLECVRVLCWHRGSASDVIAVAGADVAGGVVRVMARHAHVAEVQGAGCAALASLASQGAAGRRLVAEAAAAPAAAVHALAAFPHEAFVQGAAAAALLNLARGDDTIQTAIANVAGGVAAIVAALRPSMQTPQTCLMLCHVLCHLVGSRDGCRAARAREALHTAGAVAALVAALHEPAFAALHEPSVACVNLLAALYQNSDVRERAAIRAATVATHKRHATSEMARAACRVYARARFDDDDALYENVVGVLLYTWDALWSQMAAATAECMLSAFRRVTRGARCAAVVSALLERADRFRGVLRRLCTSKSVAELTVQLCCELLLSQNAAHLQCLVDAGFVPTLLDVMDRYPDDAEMHHRALFVIAKALQGLPLSRSALVHAHILGNGGMGTLSASAGAHTRHGGVVRSLGCILQHAASQGDAVVFDLVRAGGAHIVAKLLRAVADLEHPDDELDAVCDTMNVAAAFVPHMSSPLLAETDMAALMETARHALEPTLQLVFDDESRERVSGACARASVALQTLQDRMCEL